MAASNVGSRRPSMSSVQSTASSQRSYSTRRFEQEREQREQRAAMKAAREEAARMAAPPTPSPMSTDELLGIFNKNEVEDDPLGFSSSVLSVKSASSPRGDGSTTPTEFQEKLAQMTKSRH